MCSNAQISSYFSYMCKKIELLLQMEMTGCVNAAGILVSVKTRAQQKLHKLKESYDHLVQRVTQLQEQKDKLVILPHVN